MKIFDKVGNKVPEIERGNDFDKEAITKYHIIKMSKDNTNSLWDDNFHHQDNKKRIKNDRSRRNKN